MDIKKQPSANPVTLKNTKLYPFNNSQQTVALETSGDNTDYTVQMEVVSSTGEIGDIVISGKAINGFKIAFTGSASSAVVRYYVRDGLKNTPNNNNDYVNYTLIGPLLSFREGELALDLSQSQRDYPVHIDISEDASGCLVIGPSRRYIAEIDLPSREYTIEKGEADNFGFPKLSKTALPLDMDKVSLTLWAVEV
jgi:hypothetical protein